MVMRDAVTCDLLTSGVSSQQWTQVEMEFAKLAAIVARANGQDIVTGRSQNACSSCRGDRLFANPIDHHFQDTVGTVH